MAENARPPVAIRVVRPWDTEDALLENELETIGKTSVVLIGAHPRPTGVILRFELALANGTSVLRGEGRVLAHKDNAFRGQPGLTLRFTRLDPKSKATVDRATALREAASAHARPTEGGGAPPVPIPSPSSPELPAAPPAAPSSAPPVQAPLAYVPPSPIADALSGETPAPGAAQGRDPIAAAQAQEALVAEAFATVRDAVAPGITGRELHVMTCDIFEAAGHRTQRTGPGDDASEGFQFS
ncbi:MAG: Chaperone protein DnaK, partial [Labilithrix sp.]|nr:Chaperone protein DnaK [Labilithrix sp.]